MPQAKDDNLCGEEDQYSDLSNFKRLCYSFCAVRGLCQYFCSFPNGPSFPNSASPIREEKGTYFFLESSLAAAAAAAIIAAVAIAFFLLWDG